MGGGPPYFVHPGSAERVRQGLPVQVYCCWNGMVKLRAAPFAQGLRFRAAQPRECNASECSLMCDDFHRWGPAGRRVGGPERVGVLAHVR